MSTPMSPIIYDRNQSRDQLTTILSAYLPNSLPILRRLQFMCLPGGMTSDSCLLASFKDEVPSTGTPFVIAYLDFSRGPETEMWLFSSLEIYQHTTEQQIGAERQILGLFDKARKIELDFATSRETPGVVLIGSLHETILRILQRNNIVQWITCPYQKFIFQKNSVPEDITLPSEDLFWGTIRAKDIPLVLSRTDIPRKERTMKLLPSVAIFSKENPLPIAWGFLGPDGSLTSLHVEEPFRGQGLAKAVVAKLFRDDVTKFSADGLAHSDVALDNLQSQGVCNSLGGKKGWIIYWLRVAIDL